MAAPANGTPPQIEHQRVRSARSAWSGVLVVLVAVALVGVPLAYRVATESPATGPSLIPTAGPSLIPTAIPSAGSSPSRAPAPETLLATGLSTTDRALEQLQVADVLEEVAGSGGCDVELIPMARNRSVTLHGRVDAHDHAGWVFTCHHEAGDRTRYFRLASGLAAELSDLGVSFQGGLSYVGDPGNTLETRWTVSGDALSGEIEVLAAPTSGSTLTIVVLLDLRGSWQGQPPSP
jgi:hypothetical protein